MRKIMEHIKLTHIIIVLMVLILGMMICFTITVKVNSLPLTKTIVIDAEHGGFDGGASSKSGILEKDLNLEIALKLRDVLEKNGYNTILTRKDDNALNDGNLKAIRQKKVSDINKRIQIINESNADMVISVHINKFTEEQYKGWQAFYKRNNIYSKEIADLIQKEIKEVVKMENDRQVKEIDGVKIVDNVNIPVVIVECGFLSNEQEIILLQDEKYQKLLAEGIFNGINKWYK